MSKCGVCDAVIYEVVGDAAHTDKTCKYNQFKKSMADKDWVYIGHDEYREEILKDGTYPIDSFKWHFEGVGYVELSYIPKWLDNGIGTYVSYSMSDTTLIEFLSMMFPPNS